MSSSSENKQPLPCRKEGTRLESRDFVSPHPPPMANGTITLKNPSCPEAIKPLIERLVRLLPTDHLDLEGAECKYWKWDNLPHYTIKIELHAGVDVRLDTQDPELATIKFRTGSKLKGEEVKALLETLYCRPAVEFFHSLMKIQHYEWNWRGPPEKLKAKRTEEKVYCEHDIGEDRPRRLEIPNDKYDRALASLNSIGLEQADWASYGSYWESGHLSHMAGWAMLDVEARGDGSLWYKSLKYDFDSRAWFPVKDGPTLRGIIEAQKNMTFVDFYDKYLTFQGPDAAGADKPPAATAP